MSRVFLSYSHKDEDFVKELYRRLTRDGVECFFDKESITWGTNWVIALEKGIDECEVIILVLSPDFCHSEWTKLERTSSIADDPEGVKRKLRPLLLEPCDDTLPRFLKHIQKIDVSSPEKFEDVYPKICHELGGTVIEESHLGDRRNLPPICSLPNLHRMPYRSLGNGFIGRTEDLWEIHDILSNRKTAVVEGVGIVMGTGGLGKTQLAIEYVHRFGKFYPGGVFWVNAEQGISAMISCVVLAANVDIDNTLEEMDQLDQLWKAFNRLQHVLIVLDNFPEDEPLQPWLPSIDSIHTLVTTRRRDLNYSRLSLNFMTIEEGIKLLNSGVRTFGQEAEKIVEALGGLPLALELTRNFLNLRPDLNIDRLLEEMKRTGDISTLGIFADKYADELPSGHIKEISATFQMSFNLASSTAKTVLQCMSILAPTPVPRRLIRNILNLPSENVLEDPIDEAISELADKLSMVELDEDRDPWMHMLISGFVKTTSGENNYLHKKVFDAVENEMARVRDEKDTHAYYELEKIVPHTETILTYKFMGTEQAMDLLGNLQHHNKKWARYRIAEKYGRKLLDLCIKSFEPGHPQIATNQSNLALVLQDLGELEEARDLLREALESDKKSYEPGHSSIAISQSNLATVLQGRGELEEARDLLREALVSDKKSFEHGHPSIAIRQSNLALVLQDLGEIEEARDLLREALESAKKSFEHGHPTIAISQSNLATVLQGLGEFEEARDLLREALESAKKSFEHGHPSIAIRQSNLALVLRDLGEIEEARDLLREALESDKKSFEPGHPSIAIRQSNLALVLQDLGEIEEARDLLREALESDKKSYEPGHPSIAISQSNLAMVLKDLGEIEEASDLLREALESDKKSYEPGHPSIARSQSNLAMVLKNLGEIEEARDLSKQAYDAFLNKFGPQHPNTKTTKSNWEGI